MTADRKYIIGGSYSREQVGEVHVLEGRVVAEGYTEEGQVSLPAANCTCAFSCLSIVLRVAPLRAGA